MVRTIKKLIMSLIVKNVKDLNHDAFDEIKSVFNELKSSTDDSVNQLKLVLQDTTGNTNLAALLVEIFHSSNKVDLLIEAKGVLSSAGSLLAFAGKPGNRIASVATVFGLSDDCKKTGKKELSLTEKTTLEIAGTLSDGKHRRVLSAMKTCGALTTTEAVKLMLIDDTGSFKDKYSSIKKKMKEDKKKDVGKLKNIPKNDNKPVLQSSNTSILSDKENDKLNLDVEKQIKTPEEEVIKK